MCRVDITVSDRVLQAAIAQEIRVELARRRWSQARLLREADVLASSWRRYFVPPIVRHLPMSALGRIAAALDMQTGELLSRAEATQRRDSAQLLDLLGISGEEAAELSAAVKDARLPE